MHPIFRVFKLADRRDRWRLMWQGWFFGIALVVALLWGAVSHAHVFLPSINRSSRQIY